MRGARRIEGYMARRMQSALKWDHVVVLAYAAEQLCVASQLLTSDTVPLQRGLAQACNHLGNLVEHRSLLPRYVVTWIEECREQCGEILASRSADFSAAAELRQAILALLDEVHGVITAVNRSDESLLEAA